MLRHFWYRFKHRANLTLIKLYDKLYHSGVYPMPKSHYDLVIVKFDRIGDFVIGLDSIHEMLKLYSGKRILYVCKSYTTEIAERSNLFTDVLTAKDIDTILFNNSFKYHLRYIKQYKNIKADLVVNPTWSRIDPSDLVVHLIRSPQKYGTHGKGIGRPCGELHDEYYTKVIEQPPYDSEFHYAQYFVNNTISPSYKAELSKLSLIYKEEDAMIKGRYVVVGISASYDKRIWPMDRLSEVIDIIPNSYKVVLMGHGNSDLERVNKILSYVRNPQQIVNMVNKTTMWDMFNLISNAQFVIGMDSSPIHIAAASRVRSICIAPGAYYKRFVPYPKELGDEVFHPRTVVSSNQKCFYCAYACSRPEMKDMESLPCLMEVTAEKVKTEIMKLLEEI